MMFAAELEKQASKALTRRAAEVAAGAVPGAFLGIMYAGSNANSDEITAGGLAGAAVGGVAAASASAIARNAAFERLFKQFRTSKTYLDSASRFAEGSSAAKRPSQLQARVARLEDPAHQRKVMAAQLRQRGLQMTPEEAVEIMKKEPVRLERMDDRIKGLQDHQQILRVLRVRVPQSLIDEVDGLEDVAARRRVRLRGARDSAAETRAGFSSKKRTAKSALDEAKALLEKYEEDHAGAVSAERRNIGQQVNERYFGML